MPVCIDCNGCYGMPEGGMFYNADYRCKMCNEVYKEKMKPLEQCCGIITLVVIIYVLALFFSLLKSIGL